MVEHPRLECGGQVQRMLRAVDVGGALALRAGGEVVDRGEVEEVVDARQRARVHAHLPRDDGVQLGRWRHRPSSGHSGPSQQRSQQGAMSTTASTTHVCATYPVRLSLCLPNDRRSAASRAATPFRFGFLWSAARRLQRLVRPTAGQRLAPREPNQKA